MAYWRYLFSDEDIVCHFVELMRESYSSPGPSLEACMCYRGSEAGTWFGDTQRLLQSSISSSTFQKPRSPFLRLSISRSPSLLSSPLRLSLLFCRSERGSLHTDIMTLTSQTQKQCLISSLSGLNYCRQAVSRQLWANITSNMFLYGTVGVRSPVPQRFNMLPPLSTTLSVRMHDISTYSHSLTRCLLCWT